MTTPAHAGRTLFVALPVADIDRSRAFFGALGFGVDPGMSGQTAACLLVGEHARVMLLDQATFAQYSHLPTGDPRRDTQALYTFVVATHEEVDTLADTALAGGATEADGPEDHGFMYTRSFFDLDGHPWQVMWVNPAGTPSDVDESGTATV